MSFRKDFLFSDKSFKNTPLYILNFFDNSNDNLFYFTRNFLNINNCSNINILNYRYNISENLFVNDNTSILIENKSNVNYLNP